MRKIALVLLFASWLFSIDWITSYDKALEVARGEKKPILVVFLRDDCKYCAKLANETLSNSAIIETISKDFVPLYIDVNNNPQDTRKANLSFQGVPASFVIDSSGKQKSKLFGFQPPMSYMGFLQHNTN